MTASKNSLIALKLTADINDVTDVTRAIIPNTKPGILNLLSLSLNPITPSTKAVIPMAIPSQNMVWYICLKPERVLPA